jgi:predicted nucleotidyltransferase
MSGNFIQRGEPAIVDKWARAEMALRSGIDLVVELPLVYAMSSAEFFAFGAVKILDSLGIVDQISFGSESGNLELLETAASVLANEPGEYKVLLREALGKGISFPAARQAALGDYLTSGGERSSLAAEVLSQSNNILGVEYLKALKKLSSRMKPVTVPRISSAYNSEELTGAISSATAIRKLINRSEGNMDAELLKSIMPLSAGEILIREISAGKGPVFSSDFDGILLSILRRMSPDAARTLPYIAEGLENRIIEAAGSAGTIEDLVEKISTKRYTRTRIQRILFSALTGLTAEALNTFNSSGGPCYIRILGFNEKGRKLLSGIKKHATLPVIMKTADFRKAQNPLLSKMLELEAAATDQYVLAFCSQGDRKSGQEFTRNIVRI